MLPLYNAYAKTDTSTQDAVVDSGKKASDLSSKKATAAVTAATTSSVEFIDSSGSAAAVAGVNLRINDPSNTNAGSANISIPIKVAPGRNGIAPNLSLNYNSDKGNGWLGVGWDLSLGEIQRLTKHGVNYSANDYILIVNGASSELAPRGDWGNNYYGAKLEGAFSKFYYNTATGGWEVTTKDGIKYFYGTTAASRQDNAYGVFKWMLDKVQDTNGNYMTVTYWKDQGDIYIDRIDYTGNSAGLSPTNYVKFYWEGRTDIYPMYTSNAEVRTAYRLKTVDVVANGNRSRAYKLTYAMSGSTSRSLLSSVQQYGSDAVLNSSGEILSGTALPETTLGYQQFYYPNSGEQTSEWSPSTSAPDGAKGANFDYPQNFNYLGDVNGDGKIDVISIPTGRATFYVTISTGSGWEQPQKWGHDYAVDGARDANYDRGFNYIADVNGDGKADVITIPTGQNTFYVLLSTGTGFMPAQKWANGYAVDGGRDANYDIGFNYIADVNGDGKADIITIPTGRATFYVLLSTGEGFQQAQKWGVDLTSDGSSGSNYDRGYNYVADINGDGLTDIVYIPTYRTGWYAYLSTGTGFAAPQPWFTNLTSDGSNPSNFDKSWVYNRFVDINGDGKADLVYIPTYRCAWYVGFSTGTGFADPKNWDSGRWGCDARLFHFAELTNDGFTDQIHISDSSIGAMLVARSNGQNSFEDILPDNWHIGWGNDPSRFALGDFSGDGRADLVHWSVQGDILTAAIKEPVPDLLSSVSNGLGGISTITYEPSSAYTNTMLPFIVQTVASISVNDDNGNISTTNYAYSGGLYDPEDREFRGFSYVKATVPSGTTSETWFHQDDTFKGFPYEQITKDSAGNIYTKTHNTYESISPYTEVNFPYLKQKDDYIYDGAPTYKQAAASFTYDAYGNITRKYSLGDIAVSGDEIDEYAEYMYDTTNWMVSRPSHAYTNDSAGATKAQSWFTYDPINGNLLTVKAWLNGGTDSVTTYGYDPYGNRNSITDPMGHPPTTIAYDTTTYTYPATVTNAIGHSSTVTYDYKFGKPLTKTDANGNTTTYQYDVFGRIKEVTTPDDSTTTAYAWKESYFDGLGRAIKTRTEGSDSKVIVQQSVYDNRGLVSSSSIPYFEGIETPRWTSFTYDSIGRPTRIDNTDGTYLGKNYDKGRITFIDANGHVKVEEKDVYSRLVKIEEYSGIYPSHTLYATTTYEYNTLGNLLKVTDAASNQTIMTYDTLSRKTSINDPGMGYWTYQYDANGNLASQTDAIGQTITFIYDVINRVTLKDYQAGTDVYYIYDETFSTNSKGKLTTVTDASGSGKFYYDKLGQIIKTIKTVDSTLYTTESAYDAMGRTTGIKYPDGETVSYAYDRGGNLLGVTGFATYSSYNALGQAQNVTYANGVSTTQQYHPLNNRLLSLTTNSPVSGGVQNISYSYDNGGNITTLTDLLDGNRTQSFTYDHLNRLTQAQNTVYGTLTYTYNQIGNITYNSQLGSYTYGTKPHAVTQAGTNIYSYDANGNMIDRAGKTIAYDYENRATSISYDSSSVASVYDYSGWRVKKITPSATTVYIGKLYECTNGTCTKYMFAGSQRIASKTAAATYFYHTDHLGSTSILTDGTSGANVSECYYYPFGAVRSCTGVSAKYKFTGQEEDAETGLYYYGARYYDPQLGRFISADTIVPDPFNPQALNRYSYALNNPLRYIDPTGHGFWDKVLGAVEVVVGAVVIGISGKCGAFQYGCAMVGVALIGDGVRRLNGGKGESGGSMSCSSDGSCSGGAYSGTGDYGGGGSGGGGSGRSGSTSSDSYSDTGSYSDTRAYGPWGVPMTFTKSYTYRTSLELEAPYLSRSRRNSAESSSGSSNGNVDWVDVTLAGVSSTSALVALGSPSPQVKGLAGLVGTASTGISLTRTGYRWYQGELSNKGAAIKAALDVTPFLGKGIGKAVGRWINPDAGKSIDAAIEVFEHHKGLFEGGKGLLYDPNK